MKILLFIICLTLGALTIKEWNTPYPDIAPTKALHDAEVYVEPVTNPNLPFPELSAFNEIIERPLFIETRQPYIIEETTVEVIDSDETSSAQKIMPGQHLLSAVIITDDVRIALIQSNQGKKPQKVALGEQLDDWILSDIQPHQITLKRGEEIKYIELTIKPSPKPAKKKNKLSRKKKIAAKKKGGSKANETN